MSADIPSTMTAVRLHAPGRLEDLVAEEVPTPRPGAGEALVRVAAAAITRDELTWPEDRLPATPSYELAGEVVALGEGVDDVEVGQAVYALTDFERDGVAAEYAVVAADVLAPAPTRLTPVEAAAIPLPGLSAWQALFDHGRLRAGQRVVVHGAAGGVGAFAVQLARLHGAHVIATATGERVAAARRLGAHEVVDASRDDLAALAPVDLVVDTVGGERLARSAELVAPGGRVVSVNEPPPQEAFAARGVEGAYFVVTPDRSQLRELARLADAGQLSVVVDRTYSLVAAREAFARVQERVGRGKVVLTVR
ncbi:MAG TPA: NADP-dependent oxidoreductase [Egibacteraceae bacterium]